MMLNPGTGCGCCKEQPKQCDCIPTSTRTATSALWGITWSLAFTGNTGPGFGWVGTTNYNYPGDVNCAAATVPIRFRLWCASPTTAQFAFEVPHGGAPCQGICPNDTGTVISIGPFAISGTCSPFSLMRILPGGDPHGCPPGDAGTTYGKLTNGSGDTITIT